jgi:cholesterol transport system auxiliary component
MTRQCCLLVPLVLALNGCSGLLHSTAPALQLYVLAPPQVVTVASDADRPRPPGSALPSLRISRPLPAAGLNTDRIALLRPGNRLDYYAGSRWSAPLADVLSDLELAVFRVDARWGAVADDRSSFNADYLLQTSIERFTAEYATESGPPLIHVELHCLLIRRGDGTLVGSFALEQSVMAQENRMASVVAAFSQAAQQAIVAAQGRSDELLSSVKSPQAP